MTSPHPLQTPTGRRRLDRVLAADYLTGIDARILAEVRRLRDDAEQEETDLSYLRRLLHGRIDILKAELSRRNGESEGDLIASLPHILADGARPAPRGLGRHLAVEPTAVNEHRRGPEVLLNDVDSADLPARSTEELTAVMTALEAEERSYSDQRRAVQRVVDACSAEITRRYREGSASVTDLLNP